MTSTLKICSRCVLDSTIDDIWFDEKGVCKYCKIHDEMEKSHPLPDDQDQTFLQLIDKIKKAGKNKSHDCIIGISGGRDSTYTLLTAVRYGLRPLAVHFDNGWNSEIAVKNIKKACEKLGVDLHTTVADWEEFKNLQLAFLKASTSDADIPTDYAIYSVLYHVASREGIKYVLNGHSFRTEGTSPISWTYMDPRYVKSVLKKHGNSRKIKSFPHMNILKHQYYILINKIREVRILEYINYNKEIVDRELKEQLDWQDYGGHHYENLYTKFFQSYLLPTKFGIDKRKTELSALIRSNQISRTKALEELSAPPKTDKAVISYAINKLGLSEEDFESILNAPIKTHNDYKTLLPAIRFLRGPIKLATKLRLIPYIMYLKYASSKYL